MLKNGRLGRALAFSVILLILTVSLAVFASAERVIVVLDAGHGGIDGGTDTGIRTEKEYNLIITEYIYEYLSADDRFEVILTRSDDTYIKFLPRVMVGVENNADVIISLHFNSNTATYVNGNMAYCSVVDKYDASPLANRLLDAISDTVSIKRGDVEYVEDTGDSLGVYYWNDEKQWDMPGAHSLGKKSDYYSINTWASKFGIPSIIVEHGYLSNPAEAALIDKDETLRAMAKAQAEAIIEFYTDHTHSFEYAVDYPSNCTIAGTASSRCTVCGMKSGTSPLVSDSDGHYWRQTASAKATCTTDGYADFVCQISYNLNDKGYPCEVHTRRETYPATGHNYIVTGHTEASHGTDGVHTEVCENCGDTKTTVTPGEPHSYDVTDSAAPTCETDGITVYTCSVCGEIKEETHTAPGHNWQESAYIAATDTEDGYHEYTCETCSETKRVSELSCRHDFKVTVTEPDCTTAGKTISVCSICGYESVEEADALGHDYITQMSTEPTCTEDGFYKGKCSRCGDVITQTEAAHGHKPELQSETLTHRYYACPVCGYEETEDIHPSAKKIFSSPIVIAVIAFVILQLAVIAAIIVMHRRRKAEEDRRRKRFAGFFEENSAETDAIKK